MDVNDECSRAPDDLLRDGCTAASTDGTLGVWAEELPRRAREHGLEIEMRVVRYQGVHVFREAVTLGPIPPTRREDYERLLETAFLGKRSDGTLGDWPETIAAWAEADGKRVEMSVNDQGNFCHRSACLVPYPNRASPEQSAAFLAEILRPLDRDEVRASLKEWIQRSIENDANPALLKERMREWLEELE